MLTNRFIPSKELLKLRGMEIDVKNLNFDAQKQFEELAQTSPQIYYYGLQIEMGTIRTLTLQSTSLVPEITFVFNDQSGLIRSENFPTDDAVISVYFPSGSKLVRPIRMDFKIIYYGETNESGESLTMIKGIASIPQMFIRQFKSYSQQPSWEVMKNLAFETGLGFNSNIDTTKDKMTWLNPGQTPMWFITDVTNHAWNGESGFMWSFIDFYYNLNYLDVEQALQDTTTLEAPISAMNAATGDDSDALAPMVLTNDYSFQSTKNYFSKYVVANKSTEYSLNYGYSKKVAYYDRYGNWNDKAGSLQIFTVDSITTPGAESSTVIMKGNPTDMDFYKKNISYEWFGKIDTKNVHPDFAYAIVQNSQNLNDLQKVSVTITLPQPNYAVVRFQKVNLIFTARLKEEVNTRLSGQWLVTGITYNYTNRNNLSQTITLVKRELNIDDRSK